MIRLKRLRRDVARLPRAQRVEIARVLLLVTVIEAALRLRRPSLTKLARWLGAPLEVGCHAPAAPAAAAADLPTWAWRKLVAVDVVMRAWPVDGTCLRATLVAGQRLRVLGPTLRLGVRRHEGRVQAHAWLEVNGCSLGADNYVPLRSGGSDR